MERTTHAASITELVNRTTKGDVVSARTKQNSYVTDQDVCETHSVDDGKIVCVTVGGEIPYMIIETVTDDVYANAYTYKDDTFEHVGTLREYGVEDHATRKTYKATDWLDITVFLHEIN